MRYADAVGDWLRAQGYTHCFFVAGGGIMHLLDAFRSRFTCIPVVHEHAAGVAAEHFTETAPDGARAFALVTTGPGLTNLVTAIAGCYAEHRELLVIAGQVKSTDLLHPPERQRGVQEVPGEALCAPIAVRSVCLRAPIARTEFEALVQAAQGPHPGPVMIEICLDVQGATVDARWMLAGAITPSVAPPVTPPVAPSIPPREEDLAAIVARLRSAERPIVLLGGLVSRGMAREALPVFERLGLPVATTTSAIDRVPSGSPIFAGRPGTWGGQRAANLLVAQADLLLVIGAQLDLQQTGFNVAAYAPQAQVIHCFPSRAELDRPRALRATPVVASPDATLRALLSRMRWTDTIGWGAYVREVRALVPARESANVAAPGTIDRFAFLQHLSQATRPDDLLALCSSGGTFTGALQQTEIAPGQVATTSAAFASMGYGLATAIGAAFANPGRRVILTEGDGGFAQQLQELAVVRRFDLPITLFVIDNGGYASIRSTQRKFFGGAYLGCDPETGLGFPDWVRLFEAYGIPCGVLTPAQVTVESLHATLAAHPGPQGWIVPVDPEQPNWPAVNTTLLPDGSMTSAPLSDMVPALPTESLARVGRYLR